MPNPIEMSSKISEVQ